MSEKNAFILNKNNVIKQKPRLLYAGMNSSKDGSAFDSHFHDFLEIILIGEGFGEVHIEGNFYPVKKGDLIIYNRGAIHSENFEPDQKREVMFAAFDNIKIAGLEDDHIIKSKGAVIPTESYFGALRNYFQELVKELESDQPFHDTICASLTQIMLMQILRVASFDYELTFAKNNAYIEAKEYFDKNFTTIDSLDSVCKSLYINKFYLSHLFKQQVGIPPVKYLINKRMELAKNLLETTDINVGEIASQCGYGDIGYFCRVFKNCEGTTPLQHRYNYKQKLRTANK